MLTVNQSSSSLNCRIRVIRAENVETKRKTDLFVRIHISAGKNGSVQLNTPESSTSDGKGIVDWDETFSLDCSGKADAVRRLREGAVAFELRRRPSPAAGWGRRKSKILGRAELPWEHAFCSPGSEILAWVPLGGGSGLVVGVKVEAKSVTPVEERRRRRDGGETECCGNEWCSCEENYHLFGLAAALEGL